MMRLALTFAACLFSPLSTFAAEELPRAEYPRPDFVRADWQCLNGSWEFQFDDADIGLREQWQDGSRQFKQGIVVPYPFQSRLSGIGDTSFHDVLWYRRSFRIPESWKGKKLLLHFGAVDYRCQVWINGHLQGSHEGGQTPFYFDITSAVPAAGRQARDSVLVVRAEDPSTDRTIPRGKQYWEPKSRGIWYTRTSGIWQSVWLEPVPETHLERIVLFPDVSASTVRFTAQLNHAAPGLTLRVRADLAGEFQGAAEARFVGRGTSTVIYLPAQRLWSPERPDLYDALLEVRKDGEVVDAVKTYFGQRQFATREGRILLNNRPYFLKMVLDQGYWPDGILTPPSDEAIQYDIRMTKAFGFNGARKHQKVEDPRYLYWADRMGLLVSGEMANAQEYNEVYVRRMTREWTDVVMRDINHACIISWYPINESWGVPRVHTDGRQQAHLRALYHLTRSLDPTRFVVDNDGWDHTEATDLFTIHDYAPRGELLEQRYAALPASLDQPRQGLPALLVAGSRYNGTPFVMSEFGGIAYRAAGAPGKGDEWGYSGIEPTEDSFLGRLEGLVKALRKLPAMAGYCYTQLTDVEQEINGLMTYDRKPKVAPEKVRKIQE